VPLKDLSGKSVRDLDREDFDKLFCQHCLEYQECPRDDKKVLGCKAFVDNCGTPFTEKGKDIEMTTE